MTKEKEKSVFIYLGRIRRKRNNNQRRKGFKPPFNRNIPNAY
jgi:hypothetical protein